MVTPTDHKLWASLGNGDKNGEITCAHPRVSQVSDCYKTPISRAVRIEGIELISLHTILSIILSPTLIQLVGPSCLQLSPQMLESADTPTRVVGSEPTTPPKSPKSQFSKHILVCLQLRRPRLDSELTSFYNS
jgi:hypothetical protein